MKPLFLAAALALSATAPLQAQLTAPELEDASEFARRAAKTAVAGSQRIFAETLDTDGILERGLGVNTWKGLTDRQREQLRSVVRDHFLQSLAPPRSAASGEIAWSVASSATSDGADVLLGLRFRDRTLKTRWAVSRVGGGWRVSDVVLSDPGISLAAASLRSLGPEPVRRRDRRREAERTAYPRLAALAIIVLVLVVVAPRLRRGARVLLFLTAAAPALLFFIDGALAIRRTLAEPYALAKGLPREPWREAEFQALQADREGRGREARHHWARALAQGGPAGPIEYQMGLAARQRGDLQTARTDFERALSQLQPAPGAAKELAAIDASQGKSEDADRELERYIDLAGPDPESLSMLAVLKTNLGKTDQALEAIGRARSLVGNGWRGAEVEAQVRARAGDAAGAVAALRPLDAESPVDRAILRADPAYLPIATDPAWVAFINEKPKSPTPANTPQSSSEASDK
jgi:tetratricopeptide (TPR) repeat protein